MLTVLGLPGPLSNAVDSWSEYANCTVNHVAKAAGFVRFSLKLDRDTGRRVVEPKHYVVAFPLRDQGRQKHHSALLSFRMVQEEELGRDANEPGAVANHLRFKPLSERRKMPGADEYVEFELLSREHEVPSQQPLRISMGPVRTNKRTGQKEFVRIDMGQCVAKIATDIVEDPRDGQRIVQNRWWMCVETLRLLCNVDHIDCAALDDPDMPAQEWVLRLVDTHAPINEKEEIQECTENRDIDDLMQYIDSRGPGRGSIQNITNSLNAAGPSRVRGRRKKGAKEKELTDLTTEAANKDTDGTLICTEGASETISVDTQPELMEPISAEGDTSQSLTEDSVNLEAPSPVKPLSVAETFEDKVNLELMGRAIDIDQRPQLRGGRDVSDPKVAVVRDLLEVLDELERADAEIEEDTVASRVIFAAARKFEAKLRMMGFFRVEALGKPFDSVLHQVVEDTPPIKNSSQVVVEELESGWVLGQEVVRPALVALG